MKAMIPVESEQEIDKDDSQRLIKEEAQAILSDYVQTFEKLMEERLWEIRPCHWCGGTNKWESIYGAIVCSYCHPPIKPKLVKRWIVQEQEENENK